jgi:nucleoside-diphosphate-sugar epimerase
MPIKKEDVVLVTGASGYIASWIVADLLKLGCKVRGTVRDPQNEKKVAHLKALPGAAERLELVALDLNDETQFDRVVEGVDLIAHTASPFPASNPKHEDELIKPAVNGTLGILRAALKVPSVRAIVITSSVAAVGEGQSVIGEPQHVRGENDWANVDKAIPYSKSKALAEKAAWDFWNEKGKPWTLCTINPSFVQGPSLSAELTTSTELITKLLKFEIPVLPRIAMGFVDVRDVAEAHVRALQAESGDVNGRRFILDNQTKWFQEVSLMLNKEFSPMGYRLPTHNAPYFALWLFSWVDKSVGTILSAIGLFVEFDNSPSKSVLKIEYRDLNKTIAEAGHAAIYHGLVKKTAKYTPPTPDWTPLTSV